MTERTSKALLYALFGCAGISFVVLCAATGVGVYLLGDETDAAGSDAKAQSAGDRAAPAAPQPVRPTPAPTPPDKPGPEGIGVAPPMPIERVHIRATVETTSGLQGVSEGSICAFNVEHHPRPEADPWCRAQAVCGGQLVYGGANAGYFECRFEAAPDPVVVGGEDRTTADDGDAAMRIDSAAGTLTVRDDVMGELGAFELSARIDEVR